MVSASHAQFDPRLDHVVINVKEELDQSQKNYEALGFQITERGHHSLGSSNHLAIFGETYLELLGFEAGKGHTRPELLNGPFGLTGLVFKTTDAPELYQHLVGLGFHVEEPKSFHRPVTLEDGQIEEARFRTIHIPYELTPNGRTFYCDQLTPQYVWRDAWRKHPNQVKDIIEYVIAAKNPKEAIAVYANLFPDTTVLKKGEHEYWFQAGTAKIRFLTFAEAQHEFKDIEFDAEDTQRRVALVFKTASVQAVLTALDKGHIEPVSHDDQSVLVGAKDASGVALKFIQGE